MRGSSQATPTTLPDARPLVDELLTTAISQRASDIHIEPTAAGYEVRYRIDGLLQNITQHNSAAGRAIVTRLMVMANLLTYRLDVPQEGRLSIASPAGNPPELTLRLAIMPTTHGLRAALRLPAELAQPGSLDALQLPPKVLAGLAEFAGGDSGMLIVTGPAGSGKTTTIYALLQHIVSNSAGLSVVSLEDPVERDLPGVTQIEVSPFGQLTYERALRSILRQDPQVLMLGEIRDAATATLALQAALSGHRLICTFHASGTGGAIARLMEMGAERYQITSAVFGIITQRLVRRTANGTYQGRVPVAEFVRMDQPLRAAVLSGTDASGLSAIYRQQPGYQSLRDSAQRLIEQGLTDSTETQRVLASEKSA